MIKFFRHIRKSLLSDNLSNGQAGKTGSSTEASAKAVRYFKYAIGEIILVVIGILIALSINNWNEERKTKDTIKGIYAIVKSDLESDVKTIDWLLDISKERDSLFQRVINKEITYDDYVNCAPCASILKGFPDIKIKTRGLKLLEENSAFLNSNQDSLSIQVSDFYAYFNTEIDVATQEVVKDYYDNQYYFKNMPWYEDYRNGTFNEEFTTYALTSIDYRNRIILFYALYHKTYLMHFRGYKEEALELIESINKKIK
jgi:hypothetical protein